MHIASLAKTSSCQILIESHMNSGKPTAEIYASFGEIFMVKCWLTLSELGGLIINMCSKWVGNRCSVLSAFAVVTLQARDQFWHETLVSSRLLCHTLRLCHKVSQSVTLFLSVCWGPQSNEAYVCRGTCKGQCRTGRSVWCTTVPQSPFEHTEPASLRTTLFQIQGGLIANSF